MTARARSLVIDGELATALDAVLASAHDVVRASAEGSKSTLSDAIDGLTAAVDAHDACLLSTTLQPPANPPADARARALLNAMAARIPDLARAASEGYDCSTEVLNAIALMVAAASPGAFKLTEGPKPRDRFDGFQLSERAAPRPAAFAVRDAVCARMDQIATEIDGVAVGVAGIVTRHMADATVLVTEHRISRLERVDGSPAMTVVPVCISSPALPLVKVWVFLPAEPPPQ